MEKWEKEDYSSENTETQNNWMTKLLIADSFTLAALWDGILFCNQISLFHHLLGSDALAFQSHWESEAAWYEVRRV